MLRPYRVVTIEKLREMARARGDTFKLFPLKYTADGLQPGKVRASMRIERTKPNGHTFFCYGSAWLDESRADTALWRDDPLAAMAECAEADAYRMACPDFLAAIYSQNEPAEDFERMEEAWALQFGVLAVIDRPADRPTPKYLN